MKLTTMHDIGGVRARVRNLKDLNAVSRRLRKNWRIHRTYDYIQEPRSSGYRAIHHVVRSGERLIEVQLRTIRQDVWANQVEADSRNLGVGFKFGLGDDDVHGYYRSMARAFAYLDGGQEIPRDLVAELNERYGAVGGILKRHVNGGR